MNSLIRGLQLLRNLSLFQCGLWVVCLRRWCWWFSKNQMNYKPVQDKMSFWMDICGAFSWSIWMPNRHCTVLHDFGSIVYVELDEKGGWRTKLAQEFVCRYVNWNWRIARSIRRYPKNGLTKCTWRVGICGPWRFLAGFSCPNRIHARPHAGNASR